MEFLSQNSYYVVFGAVILIWVGIFLYLNNIDKKITYLEATDDVVKSSKLDKKNQIFIYVISFLFPFIGIIYYFISRKRLPEKAKKALIISIIAIIIGVILRLTVFKGFIWL